MSIAEIIAKTRDAGPLSADDLAGLIDGYVRGEVPDYQMAAWAMAVRLRGLSAQAISDLTTAMFASGDRLRRHGDVPRVDKHSTGGLGDKVSLILAPLLACCDVHVPMISGRGLGFSGGTLDKLESIPGLQVDMSTERADDVLRQVGCFIISAGPDIAPADRKLYALRDVIGCVDSIPLITASILSKKLAATLDALVMDVKVGAGAFMKTQDQALELARTLIQTGSRSGLPVQAMLTQMEQPLGYAVGNLNEVIEAAQVLRGEGPSDVLELSLSLGAKLLCAVSRASNPEAAAALLDDQLRSGAAYERFQQMIHAQGGRWSQLPTPSAKIAVTASESGYVCGVDSQQLGLWLVRNGGGRERLGAAINHAVGIHLVRKVGQPVRRGEPLAFVLGCKPQHVDREYLKQQFTIQSQPVPCLPLIYDHLNTVDEASRLA